MKKFLLLLFVFQSTLSFSQFFEGFENTTGPDALPSTNWTLGSGNWAVFDNGVGTSVRWATNSLSYAGTNCAYANREQNGSAGATSEDYLATPLVNIPENGILRFYSRTLTLADQGTIYQVKIATANQNNPASYTTVIAQYTENELTYDSSTNIQNAFNIYTEHVVNIPPSYYGQQIYIAFVKIYLQPTTAIGGDRWLLDNVNLTTMCSPPTTLAASPQPTSAVLDWTGTSSGYEIENVVQGQSPTGIANATSTTNSVTLSSLSPNTSYCYYVRSVCSAGNSSVWSDPFCYTTTTIPPVCGQQFTDAGGTTGSYQSNSDSTVIICPQNVGDVVTVTFSAFNTEPNYDALYVFNGNSIASTQITSTNLAGNVPGGLPGGFWGTSIPGPFTSTSPDGCLTFRFRSDNSSNYSGWIANVTCGPPLSCPTPAGLVVNAINYNSANVSWTSNSTATNYNIYAVPCGSPAPLPTTVGYLTTSTNSNSLVTGLSPATCYNVYVRDACSSTDFSIWIGPIIFTTPQAPPTCSIPTNLVVSNLLPTSATINWTQPVNPDTTTASAWEYVLVPCGSPTPNTSTIATGTATTPLNLSNLSAATCYTLYVRAICSASDYSSWSSGINFTTLYEPPVCGGIFTDSGGVNGNYPNNESTTTVICPDNSTDFVSVTFTSFSTENCCDHLSIYDGNSSSSPLIGTYQGTVSPGTIESSTPGGCLTFVWTSDGSVSSIGWVADVICAPVPTCSKPITLLTSNVLSTSATLSWTQPANPDTTIASAWEYVLVPCGSPTPNTSTIATGTATTPLNLSNLSAATCYTLYVRAICSASDYSSWSSGINFTTLYEPPVCGGIFTDSGGASGNYPNNESTTTVICPDNSTDFVSVTFTSFSTENCCDHLSVYDGNSSSSPLIGTYQGTVSPGTIESSTPGGCLTFVWTSDGSVSSIGWVADVICAPAPTCPKPTAVTVINSTTTSVTLEWNETGSATQWEVIVLPAGSPAPTTVSTGEITSVNPFTVSGLTANTLYNFYIRAICSSTDISFWSIVTIGSTSFVSLPPIVTNSTQYTNEQLITNVLVNNPCITISNVTSSTGTDFGSTNGIGYFTNTNPTFPFSSGIILSTGDVTNAPGPNTSTLNDGVSAWLGDVELENIITTATGNGMISVNATKLEFDFTSLNEFMSFNFLFASEEYGLFQCSYSDAFAFLLTDLETGITTNLAVVPGTTTPISVVTIRNILYNSGCNSVNPNFFGTYYTGNNNYISATNFNGQTVEMTASSAIIANHPYHIKLVVADRSDTSFDSAVFIKAGSFTSGPPQCSDKIELVAFLDDNNNGVQDVGEPIFNYGSFVTQQNNSGPITNISSPFGTYTVYDSNPSNTYDFSYELNSEYAPYYSAGSVSYNDVNVALGSGTQTLYFPITLTNGFNDVTVSIVSLSPPRPGFSYINKVVYKNSGVVSTSGTITFNKDPQVNITSVSQSGVVTNATGFTYAFSNLAPYETRAFNVTMSVPSSPTINLGDVLTNSTSISAPANDIYLSNNTFTNSQIVVASYDPNDKMEAHGDKIQFDQFSQGDYLYYTIRFQNNGTANAISVRIEDVLDAQLDETSIRMISASHNYIMERIENNIVWKFDNINLPPALANEDLSKGYVFFKIKLKPGFNVGDIVPNTASIYFDENPAIVTNTFNTEFVTALSNQNFEVADFILYPNPAKNNLFVQLNSASGKIDSIVIYDVLGNKIRAFQSVASNSTTLDVSNLPTGLYFVELKSDTNLKQVKKLVIK